MKYRLIVKHSVELLEKALDLFCGNARLSLEGDLSQCDFEGLSLLADESRGELSVPNNNDRYVVLALDNSTMGKIKNQILSRAGIRTRIHHLVIEKNNKMMFAAYDNFNEDSVWISDEIKSEILDELVSSKIIHSYELLPD